MALMLMALIYFNLFSIDFCNFGMSDLVMKTMSYQKSNDTDQFRIAKNKNHENYKSIPTIQNGSNSNSKFKSLYCRSWGSFQ